MTITVDTPIGAPLAVNAAAAPPLPPRLGMHCLGCPSARGESIAQACLVHGVDADEIVEQLNKAINAG